MEHERFGPLRSLAAWTALTQWTLLLAPVAVTSCLFDRGHTGWQIARNLWSTAWLQLFGQELEVTGSEHVRRGQPAVYIANHQSFLDVPAIFRALPINLRFLCKKSLRYYPAIGPYLVAAGHVFVDRSNPKAARESMAEAARKVHDGTPILIFPEGTRTRDGKLQPFKKGAFVLAIEAQVPIVPVAVSNSWENLGRGFRPKPGKLQVRIGPPLSTAGYSYEDRNRLRDEAHEALVELMHGAVHASWR